MDWQNLQKFINNQEGNTMTDTPADVTNTPPGEQHDATTDEAVNPADVVGTSNENAPAPDSQEPAHIVDDPDAAAPVFEKESDPDYIETTEPIYDHSQEAAPVDGAETIVPEEAAPIFTPEEAPEVAAEETGPIDNPFREGDSIYELDLNGYPVQREGVVLATHDDGSTTVGFYASVERVQSDDLGKGTAVNPA